MSMMSAGQYTMRSWTSLRTLLLGLLLPLCAAAQETPALDRAEAWLGDPGSSQPVRRKRS